MLIGGALISNFSQFLGVQIPDLQSRRMAVAALQFTELIYIANSNKLLDLDNLKKTPKIVGLCEESDCYGLIFC